MRIKAFSEKRTGAEGETVRLARDENGTEYRLLRTASGEKETVYSLSVRSASGEMCLLTDVARRAESADRLFELFLREGVSPINAAEVAEELLAREPSLFV